MLEFNKVSIIIKKDNRPIIKDFTFVLHPKEKMAIIGEEGNGKSTLLKLVTDQKTVMEYATVTGQVNTKGLHIGYLEQSLQDKWKESSVIDYFLKDNPDEDVNFDNYNYLTDIYSLFAKFGLDDEMLEEDRKIKTLSGGEKVKIQIIKILCKKPDVLLLDEPTNDIDIETLEWLENFINNSDAAILYVSHDETLLENTATGIIHLESTKKKIDCRHTVSYEGYKDYIELRNRTLSHQEMVARKEQSDYNKQMAGFREVYQKVEYQQKNITRADPHGAALLKKKMKSLKSQEKRYEREKENFTEIPDVEEAITIKNVVTKEIPSGKMVLDISIPSLVQGEKELSRNVSLSIFGSKHVVIIGRNGAGKTTFLKKIYEDLKTREDIQVGYMSQNYDELLDLAKTPLELLTENDKSKDFQTQVRTYLGSLKFTKEEVLGKIENLSGGQKAKLLLIKLILDQSNVLILDEPTRNLSPLSNPVIRKLLKEFKGTIISVSHDRKYIDEVCNEIYELTPEGLIFRNEWNHW